MFRRISTSAATVAVAARAINYNVAPQDVGKFDAPGKYWDISHENIALEKLAVAKTERTEAYLRKHRDGKYFRFGHKSDELTADLLYKEAHPHKHIEAHHHH